MAEKPTQEQLIEEDGLRSVERVADDSWRHGAYITQVFQRIADDTFWLVQYRLSTDGETNELSEGIYTCEQAEPFETTVTKYRLIAPQPKGSPVLASSLEVK